MVARILLLNAVVTCLGLLVLPLLARARELKTYWPMLVVALWQAPPYFLLMFLRHVGPNRIDMHVGYRLFFWTYWTSYTAGSIFSMVLTYTVFHTAMRPLKGLQSLGNIMFVWAAAISLATALSASISPSDNGAGHVISAASQFQRSSAILVISLTLFVALSIRPMGLSWRSRIFGASLGTMMVSVTDMLQASFLPEKHSLFTGYDIVELISSGISLCIWAFYFAVPEPKRKFILLPTTSPFHYWNKASQMLGHDPGVVAIGGVAPDVIAKAEMEIFRRASLKITEADARIGYSALPESNDSEAELRETTKV